MKSPYDMTVDEIKAEIGAVWDELERIPEHLYLGLENEPRRERLHALAAALHCKRLEG